MIHQNIPLTTSIVTLWKNGHQNISLTRSKVTLASEHTADSQHSDPMMNWASEHTSDSQHSVTQSEHTSQYSSPVEKPACERAFCVLFRQELVEHYEHNELADSFPDVATTLRIPYKTVASKCPPYPSPVTESGRCSLCKTLTVCHCFLGLREGLGREGLLKIPLH